MSNGPYYGSASKYIIFDFIGYEAKRIHHFNLCNFDEEILLFTLSQMFSTFFILWHKLLIAKILWHTKNYIFFASLTKNRYNFDSFI